MTKKLALFLCHFILLKILGIPFYKNMAEINLR